MVKRLRAGVKESPRRQASKNLILPNVSQFQKSRKTRETHLSVLKQSDSSPKRELLKSENDPSRQAIKVEPQRTEANREVARPFSSLDLSRIVIAYLET